MNISGLIISNLKEMRLEINFNEEFDFRELSGEKLKAQSEKIIRDTEQRVQKIAQIPAQDRTFENTMQAIDEMYSRIGQVFSTIYLLAYVLAEDEPRTEAQMQIAELDKFANALSLNEDLYRSVNEFSQTQEAKELSGYKKRFAEKSLKDFLRNGFALSAKRRADLKKLKDKISDLSLQFDTNIAEAEEFLIFSEAKVKGLPEDYLNTRKTKDENYKITLDYPSYRPFMKNAENVEARKKLHHLFLNRAADKNQSLLKQILQLRKQMAELLGYKSYAEYAIEDKMAKSAGKVWNFEFKLEKAVRQKALRDLAEIKTLHDSEIVQSYDAAFLTNKLLKEKYLVDEQQVKEFFPVDNVINGLFELSKTLFDVDFKQVSNEKAWHQEVKVYEIYQTGKLKGRFFFDLFPRPKKFNHAAMFPMVSGRRVGEDYQLPVAALVTNFPKPSKEKPSLLPHNEVVTLFHEFGHLLHGLLTTAPLASMAGTSVARDFVETPSQLLENWAWNYDSLRKFAFHYKTKELLPKDLFDKMYAAKNVGSGLHILQQIFYGQLDMFLHDKYDAKSEKTTTELVKEMQNRITLYPYLEDTHFEASFGHLIGYAAGYYGYLWALVFSADIFSVFEEKAVLSPELGRKLEQKILSQGSSSDEYQLLTNFLGREPNNKAFLKSIGL